MENQKQNKTQPVHCAECSNILFKVESGNFTGGTIVRCPKCGAKNKINVEFRSEIKVEV